MGGRGGSRTLSRPFGRDALITSLQLLPVRPQMAQATLRALAERQGREAHPGTQEELGKIGHEFRPSAPQSILDAGWPEAGDFRYYGSADATSWFCVVLARTHDERLVRELEPAWRAAGDWIARTLDSGGGLLRHGPGSFPGGLSQQAGATRSIPRAQALVACCAPTAPARGRRSPTWIPKP
jgi:glycogen debranching enzyme